MIRLQLQSLRLGNPLPGETLRPSTAAITERRSVALRALPGKFSEVLAPLDCRVDLWIGAKLPLATPMLPAPGGGIRHGCSQSRFAAASHGVRRIQ
jgi:hypothetical protein